MKVKREEKTKGIEGWRDREMEGQRDGGTGGGQRGEARAQKFRDWVSNFCIWGPGPRKSSSAGVTPTARTQFSSLPVTPV